jgi:alpha-beta hydrolase superfamily lysophospholipase
MAILIFHGITAYSGAYEMAAVPFSEGGYTTFGLDYRGYGFTFGGLRRQNRKFDGSDLPVSKIADYIQF